MRKLDVPQTKRQEWTEFSGLIQADINQQLQAASLVIEAANAVLSDKYQNDPAGAGDFAAKIAGYLNKGWSYTGDCFMVSGHWHEPAVGMTPEGIISRHEKKEVFQLAPSNGFIVLMPQGQDYPQSPRIGMSFVVGSANLATQSIKGNFQLLAFGELNEISLQYMRPGNSSVVSAELGEVMDTLGRADALLGLYTNHKDSSFYRQSASKQQAFFRSIIDFVDNAMPAPDSLDRLMLHEADTPVMYIRKPHGEGLIQMLSGVADRRFKVTGEVLGTTVHDLIEDGYKKRYSSPDEIGAAIAGLSLIVKPHAINVSSEEFYGQDLLLPVRKIGRMFLQIV